MNSSIKKPRKFLIDMVSKLAHKNSYILDFGAGKNAVDVMALHRAGFAMTQAYEIGRNFNPNVHIASPRTDHYDLVLLNNVLNIQPTFDAFSETYNLAIGCCKRERGRLLVHIPPTPRRHNGFWASNDVIGYSAKRYADDLVALTSLLERDFEEVRSYCISVSDVYLLAESYLD